MDLINSTIRYRTLRRLGHWLHVDVAVETGQDG